MKVKVKSIEEWRGLKDWETTNSVKSYKASAFQIDRNATVSRSSQYQERPWFTPSDESVSVV